MIVYDSWLDSFPGGPDDPDLEQAPSAYEQAQEEFHSLVNPYAIAKARRMAKRSTQRRMNSVEWYRRQRREDQNAQVCF